MDPAGAAATPGSLRGEICVVTGGARGTGRGIALRLAQDGGDVAIWDINPSLAEETCGLLRDLGVRALALAVDVADTASVGRERGRSVAARPRTSPRRSASWPPWRRHGSPALSWLSAVAS